MGSRHKLEVCFKSLHLSGVRAYYEELTQAAEQETMRYDDYLLELLLRECEVTWLVSGNGKAVFECCFSGTGHGYKPENALVAQFTSILITLLQVPIP